MLHRFQGRETKLEPPEYETTDRQHEVTNRFHHRRLLIIRIVRTICAASILCTHGSRLVVPWRTGRCVMTCLQQEWVNGYSVACHSHIPRGSTECSCNWGTIPAHNEGRSLPLPVLWVSSRLFCPPTQFPTSRMVFAAAKPLAVETVRILYPHHPILISAANIFPDLLLFLFSFSKHKAGRHL
jgi:hypothetical protein